MHQIEDMGYIPMAKKELYNFVREATAEEIDSMHDADLAGIRKTAIWTKPETIVSDDGRGSLEKAYFIYCLWNGIHDVPVKKDRKSILSYAHAVRDIKEKASHISTTDDIGVFYKKNVRGVYYIPCGASHVSLTDTAKVTLKQSFLRNCQMSADNARREAKKKKFGFTAEDKKKMDYGILQLDGIQDTYDPVQRCIIHREPGRTAWLYARLKQVDISKCVPGNYVLYDVKNHGVLAAARSREDLYAVRDSLILAKKAKKADAKKAFTYPGRPSFGRNGYNYLQDLCHGQITLPGLPGEMHAEGPDFSERFSIPAIQYGNWMSDKERQFSLDQSYNALKDLADILGISDTDISLGGKLGLAFGARGSGAAAAHYEPVYICINLTKMHGAGCLAHEWGHALDHYIGRAMGSGGTMVFASEDTYRCKCLGELKRAMMYSGFHYSDFYCGSRKFDQTYSEMGLGYWSSMEEMFARAFDCYIHDKLIEKGRISEYLTGFSESFVLNNVYAIPQGEERQRINIAFDHLFQYLKDAGLLHSAK